jgi:hypothetical protein
LWPSYKKNQSEISQDEPGPKQKWKSIQHHKVHSGNSLPCLIPAYTEKWAYYPDIYLGYSKNPLFGYLKYYSGSELMPYGSPGFLNNGLPAFNDPQPDGVTFIPAPAGLDDLNSTAMRVMLPAIKEEMSLVNSVIELKDFRSMIRLGLSAANNLNKVVPTVRAWLTKATRDDGSLRTLSRLGASGFLQWEFAFAPLLSDIAAFQAALLRTEKRMNDLITRAGRPQVRHFTYKWVEFPDVKEEQSNPGFGFPKWENQTVGLYDSSRQVIYEPTVFHAQVRYNYYFSNYQLEHARVLSLLDSLGINLNPAIIWNAIPWSFVVDWVIGVNRWLDTAKVQNMEPLINIRDYLWSVKRSRKIRVSRGIVKSYYGLVPGQQVPLAEVTETAYRRQYGMPSWVSLTASGLSPKELSLGAALVIARKRRPSRKSWSKFLG